MTIIGAHALIRWEEEDEPLERYISFGTEIENEDGDIIGDQYGWRDDGIFFYGSLEDESDYRKGVHGWFLIDWELNDNTSLHFYKWYKVVFKMDGSFTEVSQLVYAPNVQVAITVARSILKNEWRLEVTEADRVTAEVADPREYED